MSDYYLIDNPPVRRQFKARVQTGNPNLIVVHTSEQPPDIVGDDHGAEKLAAYIQRRTSAGCYHTAVDADSTVAMVPPGLQCFGARYVNDRALHVSHATKAAAWGDLPTDYRSRMLAFSAGVAAQWCQEFDIPPVQVTDTASIIAGTAVGICSHADVDPMRRTDPGVTFPWWSRLRRHRSAGTICSRLTAACSPRTGRRSTAAPVTSIWLSQ